MKRYIVTPLVLLTTVAGLLLAASVNPDPRFHGGRV